MQDGSARRGAGAEPRAAEPSRGARPARRRARFSRLQLARPHRHRDQSGLSRSFRRARRRPAGARNLGGRVRGALRDLAPAGDEPDGAARAGQALQHRGPLGGRVRRGGRRRRRAREGPRARRRPRRTLAGPRGRPFGTDRSPRTARCGERLGPLASRAQRNGGRRRRRGRRRRP